MRARAGALGGAQGARRRRGGRLRHAAAARCRGGRRALPRRGGRCAGRRPAPGAPGPRDRVTRTASGRAPSRPARRRRSAPVPGAGPLLMVWCVVALRRCQAQTRGRAALRCRPQRPVTPLLRRAPGRRDVRPASRRGRRAHCGARAARRARPGWGRGPAPGSGRVCLGPGRPGRRRGAPGALHRSARPRRRPSGRRPQGGDAGRGLARRDRAVHRRRGARTCPLRAVRGVHGVENDVPCLQAQQSPGQVHSKHSTHLP